MRPVYRAFIADSSRWEGFECRPGDVVISTPSKSGTTWMQMLVALLIFDGPDLPAPLSELSPWPDDPHERFRFSIDLDRGTNHTAAHLAHVLHHLDTAWQRRHLPNVALFHYADLLDDLPGELSRLAWVLGIALTNERAGDLAAEATIERMRSRAAEVAPDGSRRVWKDPAKFFRSGGSGGRRSLSAPELDARYEARVAELVDPELARWAHHGWRGVGGAGG